MKSRQSDSKSQDSETSGQKDKGTRGTRIVTNYLLSLLAGVVATSLGGCALLGNSREPQLQQIPAPAPPTVKTFSKASICS